MKTILPLNWLWLTVLASQVTVWMKWSEWVCRLSAKEEGHLRDFFQPP